jgi:hypothetical protein
MIRSCEGSSSWVFWLSRILKTRKISNKDFIVDTIMEYALNMCIPMVENIFSCFCRQNMKLLAIYAWVSIVDVETRGSRDSSVGIAIRLLYRLDDRGSRVRFPAAARNFSLHHRVQNGSGVHLASYPMGTRSSFPGVKASRSWNCPLTSISCRGSEYVELYLRSAIRLHGVVLN